jgi:hypothetical protein
MGDLIEVMDTVSVNVQRRMSDGKPDQFELCIIYPEVLDRDNRIKKYQYQSIALSDLGEIIRKIETVFI